MGFTPENDEKRRLTALKLYGILDTLPEVEFDNIAQLASEICQTPIAVISFVDEDRQWFKSTVGTDMTQLPRNMSLCTYTIQGDDVFEVTDAAQDPRFSNNPLVTGPAHIRYYAGAPLITQEGDALGTLCVINKEPHQLTDGQKRSLKILAHSVMSILELRHKEKEAQFFKNALDEVAAVSVIDNSYHYQYANTKFCDLTELTADEIVGKHYTEVKLTDIEEDDRTEIVASVREGRIFRGKIRNENKNGDVTWSNITVIPFLNDRKEVMKLFALRVDVTAEEKMLQRFEAAERLSAIGSWEFNLIKGTRYWSKGLYEIVGFDMQHLPVITPSLIDFMVAEDKAIVEESLSARIRGEQPLRELQEVRVITKDGRHRIFAIAISINKNYKGEAVSLSGTVQDITDRKATEAKYRSLVEETSQKTFITDIEGRFTYASPRLKKVIGYKDEEILGKQFAFIYDDEWRKNTIKFYVQQLQEGKAETQYVFPVKTKDGRKLWFEQIAFLIKEDNEVKGFRCVVHDITDRVNTEQTMLEAARLATEAKEMQQNFLGKMSHEIRTPMNGVVGMVNLLRNTELSEKQRLYVESIRESAGNLLRILNDILDLSKIEAGKMTFEETEFDLVKLVNSVILNIRPGADEKKLIVASYIDDRIPRTLVADPLRLNQVLLNLAGNALKFTERGSIVIRVELQSMTDSGMTLKFSVSDSGIGIPKDKQAGIFESFQQADTFTTRKYGGSGLGLTIARQLIEQQGGTIDLQSEEGKGTIFHFTFNCKWPEQKPVADEGKYVQPAGDSTQLGSYHILLVEDNIINQMVAQHTIENWGARVTIADNGKKAMDLLRAHKYDLVLMDLQLPEISGIQTTTMIRRDLGLDVPIIAMTASAMKNERDACIAAGMNDYFSKPFEYDDLNKILHRHLAVGLKPEKEKLFDLSGLLSFVDNDVDFAREILALFVAKMPALLQEVKAYTKDRDIMQLRSVIHSIKGTVSYFGEDEVNELLSDIEAQLRANVLTPVTVTRIDLLSQKLERLISEATTESQLL